MMAAVLREVHPSELLNCSCGRPKKPVVWPDDVEEKPRCFKCVKPVQEFARLERSDRAMARWRMFYLGILDIMQFDDPP